MPTFIKTGYWEKIRKGLKGYLDLDLLIKTVAKPYKSYTITATQTGTNNPVVTILQNDYNSSISFVRTATGTYTIVSSGAEFAEGQTLPGAIQIAYDENENKLTAEWTSSSIITIKTYTNDVLTDGILSNTSIYIETYN